MIVEISGDELFFQTISKTGKTVDSGIVARRKVRADLKPAPTAAPAPAPAK